MLISVGVLVGIIVLLGVFALIFNITNKKNESIEEEFTQDQILKDWFELNE